MQVECALFTSARTTRHAGYQVVSRSDGIHDRLSRFLSQWGPTHGALLGEEVHADSLNYVPIDQDYVAVSRTLYGGPEYSARGALQVVTIILVAKRSQLSGYDFNPVSFARTSLLLGHLWRLREQPPKMPVIELPEQVPTAVLSEQRVTGADRTLVERSAQALRNDRVAVIGAVNPLAAMGRLVDALPPERRLEASFTTGLVPSQHRRFRVHMIPSLDAKMHQRLSQQGIRFVASEV